MTGCEVRRAAPAGVFGASSFRGAFIDCTSFMDRGLNVQSFDRLRMSGTDLVGALDEALEEESGDLFGAALLEPVTAGEAEEGFAGLGEGGEEGAELGELGGASAVLEGVEVAVGCSGAGASAAATGFLGRR